MKLIEFDYKIKNNFIAQHAYKERDKCRLMVLNKKTKRISHKRFYDLIDFLKKGDILVLNNTKVIPAKLVGYKEPTKGKVQLLLISKKQENETPSKETWKVLINKVRGIKEGLKISFKNSSLIGTIISKESNELLMEFNTNGEKISFNKLLEKIGIVPLPQYIKRDFNDTTTLNNDKEDYQTVYAKLNGSIAAPTAGMHFTKSLLTNISNKGVLITEVTLHIGYGTFKPVRVQNIREHHMEEEYFEISTKSAELINKVKKTGGRIVAVGTSTTRVLETIANKEGFITGCKGWTDLFIYDDYRFKVIDALITNFHLPMSTNLMLVCAFTDKDTLLSAYEEAISKNYRFYSYGDAMYIY